MREDVLTLEYQEVFDKVAVRIAYQNEEVLKRGKFKDEEIGVESCTLVSFIALNGTLYIRGTWDSTDKGVGYVSKKRAKEIKEKVRLINEKYGVKKRWKPFINESYYFFIGSTLEIACVQNANNSFDINTIKKGYHFKTMEQIKRAKVKMEKALDEFWEQEEAEDENYIK